MSARSDRRQQRYADLALTLGYCDVHLQVPQIVKSEGPKRENDGRQYFIDVILYNVETGRESL